MSTLDNQDRETISRFVKQAIDDLRVELGRRELQAGMLVGLIASAENPKAMLGELQRLATEIREGQRQLAIDRKQHEDHVRADQLEHDAREREVRSAEVHVAGMRMVREGEPSPYTKLTGRPPPASRTVAVDGTGLTRTFIEDELARDAHYS